MSISAFRIAIEHHIWATDQIIDACAALTHDELTAPNVGTYGPIIETLRHMVQSDSHYLRVLTGGRFPQIEDEATFDLADLKAAMSSDAQAWRKLVAEDLDADRDVEQHGDGWEFHAPVGLRVAQAVHHGTDHRSQICTALTSLGLTPPDIDLWIYGEVSRTTREFQEATVEA
jgi:uncharacterized damage-inducible protein DinB